MWLDLICNNLSVMFYLRRKGSCRTANDNVAEEDEFGWWLEDQESIEESRTSLAGGTRSSESWTSMMSCVDSEDEDNCAAARIARESAVIEQRNDEDHEEIELATIAYKQDLDVDLIERDARRDSFRSTSHLDSNDNLVKGKPRGVCYTPERLIRTQEYRILTHSPRYLSVSQAMPTLPSDSLRMFHSNYRQRANDLINAKQPGASRLEALLNLDALRIKVPVTSARSRQSQRERTIETSPDTLLDPLAIANKESPVGSQTLDPVSVGSSCEKVNINWKDRTKTIFSSCQESSNDRSNVRNSNESEAPLCLCDELARASTSFAVTTKRRARVTAVNEVVSILEGLEKDPNRVAALLEEERFCESNSSHDYLTRLALAIEPDGNVPAALSEPLNLIYQLRGKVESLQDANKDIQKDICTLTRDLQYDEKRVSSLTSETTKLRQELDDMRYFDDLLKLLRGELERISHRNWPFVLGHTECHTEEINFVV